MIRVVHVVHVVLLLQLVGAWQASRPWPPRPGGRSICMMSADLDPYKTLGVSRSASTAEIKKAFREKATSTHPDRNKDLASGNITPDEAQDRFQAVGNAYEILKDPEKRQEYDTYGRVGGMNGGGASQADMEDLFAMFMKQRQAQQRPRPKPFPQPEMEAWITADVEAIHKASRASNISMDKDEIRADFAGKQAVVALVDPRDNSAKVRVMISPGRAAEIWYPNAALWDARLMKKGAEVNICPDVAANIRASRRAGISAKTDSIREECAGKAGVVLEVDESDFTAKVRVVLDPEEGEEKGRAVVVWFAIAGIEPQRRSEPEPESSGPPMGDSPFGAGSPFAGFSF